MPLPTGNLFQNFNIHGCFYRHIDDLSVPWVPSPVVLPREFPTGEVSGISDGSGSYMTASPQTFTSSIAGERHPTPVQKPTEVSAPTRRVIKSRSGGWLVRIIRRILRRRDRFHEAHIHQETPLIPQETSSQQRPLFRWKGPFPPTPPMEVIPLSEWKAWGYYAAPFVNGTFVKNQSPRSRHAPPQLDLEAMFDSLRIPDAHDPHPTEAFHPERWIRGQRLPSLPPRPILWAPLISGQPLPFPWETQLNPVLTLLDTPTRTPTISWNVSAPDAADLIMFNTGPNGPMCPLQRPDYLQPATWPFVTHMYLNGIAFASDNDGWWARDYRIPWPVTVQNREGSEGVLLDDVLHGIQSNFATPVGRRDWDKWSDRVKERAKQAYRIRIQSYSDKQTLTRADWLGADVYFYGLRPSSYMDPGWTLLMGPQPP